MTEKKLHEFFGRYQIKKGKQNLLAKERVTEVFAHYLENESRPTRIFINTVGRIIIVPLTEIVYFSARDNFTEIFMQDGTKHTSGKSIKTYQDAIARSRDFIRVHRSYIINKQLVRSVLRDSRKQRLAVLMSNGNELEMSYLKKDKILEMLKY